MRTISIATSVVCFVLAAAQTFAQPQHIPTPEEIPPGYVQIDGDVIMHIEDVNFDDVGPRTIFAPSVVWPNNQIPIEYDANTTAANRTLFASVLAQWTAVCSVTFPARTGQAAYLHVMGDASICGFDFATSAGYTGGRVEIHVSTQGAPGCVPAPGFPPDGWNLFQLVHEVGHVMGFQHEQGRDDRESSGFVHIETDNISSGNASQFSIYNPQRHYGPYDFDSVMHYGACSFNICGASCTAFDSTCRTLSVLPPYALTWQSNIGQRNHLSLMDQKLASFMYRPSNWRFLDPGQSGSTNLGTVQEPFTTMVSALQNTPSGGTIQMAPGSITVSTGIINQSVTLRPALWDVQMNPNTGTLGPANSGNSMLVR